MNDRAGNRTSFESASGATPRSRGRSTPAIGFGRSGVVRATAWGHGSSDEEVSAAGGGQAPEQEQALDVVAGCNKPAKPERGVNRRGAEKARGRNVAGLGKSRAEWTHSHRRQRW